MISEGELDWESRRAAFQAIRRAVLRESVLLRLLPSEKERDDSGWGELLVEKFFTPLPQQRESTADRICVFLEDLMAASGEITDPHSARFALYDATRLRDQQFVALVSGVHGSKDKNTRERVFSGFNTPLLPEVLICTSVGQEGTFLHASHSLRALRDSDSKHRDGEGLLLQQGRDSSILQSVRGGQE